MTADESLHEEVLRSIVSGDALILDSVVTGDVTGEMLGLAGNGRRVTSRILHVFGPGSAELPDP